MDEGNGQDVALDETTRVEDMDLVGGAIALDFVNTGSHRASPPFKEKLRAYDDLVTFGARVDADIDDEVVARRPFGAAG